MLRAIVGTAVCLLISSADKICKQFRHRSGWTICQAWSRSVLFDWLVYLKYFFEKLKKHRPSAKKVYKITKHTKTKRTYTDPKWKLCTLFLVSIHVVVLSRRIMHFCLLKRQSLKNVFLTLHVLRNMWFTNRFWTNKKTLAAEYW